ncbi:MAG TPA: hypothetical protein VK779_04875 [Rhizomicrobium sp.]|nr:hypothetical protein [Rhizomicrobium sp.]
MRRFLLVSMAARDFTSIPAFAWFHVHGRVMDRLRPHEDRTDYWVRAVERFPEERAFLRKKVHAALRADRAQEAEAGLGLLLRRHRLAERDCNLVTGMANLYHREGDEASIRFLVRRFLESLQGTRTYRIAALRLSRLIFAHFPRAEEAGEKRAVRGFAGHLRKMLQKSPAASKPKNLLLRVIEMEHKLAAEFPPALFDTHISPAQCRAFIEIVRARLAAGTPFSFIRVGDGEATCLPYEPHLARFAVADAADRERTWWGKPLDPASRTEMSALVAGAIWDADCIGVPTVSRFLRDIRLEQDDALETGRTGRGLRAALSALENIGQFRPRHLQPPIFTSCHLHQDIGRWNLYSELLNGVGEAVVISCHPGLAEIIEQRFALRVVGNVLVPPRHASLPVIKARISDTRNLPEMIDDVASRLGDLPRGRLVIVGAGYLGKWLAGLAKARGGIVLDLGSIVDYWVGIRTRSYVDLG